MEATILSPLGESLRAEGPTAEPGGNNVLPPGQAVEAFHQAASLRAVMQPGVQFFAESCERTRNFPVRERLIFFLKGRIYPDLGGYSRISDLPGIKRRQQADLRSPDF